MWPGSNPPMGPPPMGQGPPGGPGPSWGPAPPLRPSAGWYALPIILVVVAAIGFFTMVAFLWDDSEAANGPSASGDPASGVTIELSRGYGYFLYVRTGGASPFACSVEVGDRSGPIQLTRKNSWSASEHRSYRYTASFEAPVSGTALLTCRGTDGPILVTPDDTVHGYLGLAFLAALGVGVIAAIAFTVTLVRRGGAKRRAAAAAFPADKPPYGY
ncbi:hypothetical protein E1287_03500 [Actinomadura sp. KC06]|uniref:hypothetical protein n=1 Tax=Actinomadura sp. KC06 TaxID=2530369 RepID=UPI00104E3B11|nr:hypothetical protein [Actinomadura sp. KC06]TDD39505.1 hypothetical protein E1287_03500 [Actinomadura sp. KC06]